MSLIFALSSFILFEVLLHVLRSIISKEALSIFADHLALPSDALGGGGGHVTPNELEMSPLIPKDSVITLDYVSAFSPTPPGCFTYSTNTCA